MLIIITPSLIQDQVEIRHDRLVPMDVLHCALRLEVADSPERRQLNKV